MGLAIYPEEGWMMENNRFKPISIFFYALAMIFSIAVYLLSMHYRQRIQSSKLDFLTGSYSKKALIQYFNKKTKGKNKKHGILFLDLNNFKSINDSLGHPIGDKVLIKVAEKIEQLLGRNDCLSRFAGDEYIIFIENISGNSEIMEISSLITDKISNPMTIEGHKIKVEAAIGSAIFPKDGLSFEELYEKSDYRMYQNK